LIIVLLVLLLAIVLLGLLLLARFTDSHYLFSIFKLFLSKFREIFTIFRQFYYSLK
jgi:cytochrome b561